MSGSKAAEFEAGVGGGDFGFAFVDDVVVLGTQETEFVDVGWSASCPPTNVMDLAPLGCRATCDAALVPGDHRNTLSRGGESR